MLSWWLNLLIKRFVRRFKRTSTHNKPQCMRSVSENCVRKQPQAKKNLRPAHSTNSNFGSVLTQVPVNTPVKSKVDGMDGC